MPIRLEEPIVRDPVTRAEIVQFTIDLRANILRAEVARMTDAGEIVGTVVTQAISLRTDAGSPRFTQQEYNTVKAAIYRMLIEDGIIAGTVV